MNFSRPPGSQVEESFICRLGEIQVCVQELLRLSVHLIVLGWRAGLGLLLSCLVEGLGSGGVVLGPLSSSLGIWLAELPLSFQVVDANSLLAPLPHVQNVTISQVCWLPPTSGSEGLPAQLGLSCTLHWSYLLRHVRGFRIHSWQTTGSSPSREPPGLEKPTFLGLAFVNQYRVVNLVVEATRPGQDGRVEFLVEPVPKEGFLVPQAEWGRAALIYSAPQ